MKLACKLQWISYGISMVCGTLHLYADVFDHPRPWLVSRRCPVWSDMSLLTQRTGRRLLWSTSLL